MDPAYLSCHSHCGIHQPISPKFRAPWSNLVVELSVGLFHIISARSTRNDEGQTSAGEMEEAFRGLAT